MSPKSASSLLHRIVAHAGIDYLALGFFVAVFAVLMMIYGTHFKLIDGSVIWPTVVLIGIVATRYVSRMHASPKGDLAARRGARHEALLIVRDWVPLILMILVYENLRGLTGIIRPDAIDQSLYEADVAIFGVEPTLWMGRFVNPWFTDWFAFAYMLYFILPVILATTLYVKKKLEDFREMMMGVLMVQYVGFMLYVAFPAGPPRFWIKDLYEPKVLHGALGLYELTHHAYDKLNAVPAKSSFPSLHCALSLVGLLFAWRFRKSLGSAKLFWAFLPFVVSLWISVVYLRHHWIVDAFAGWALAIAVFLVTSPMRRLFAAYRARVLEPELRAAPAAEPAPVAATGTEA